MKVSVRLAGLADVGPIREIYNYYVLRSTCTFQLERETFADRMNWLQQRGPRHPVVVAEAKGQVVGWGSLSPWSSRAGYARTVEVSFYVHHDYIRQGVGRALLADLIARAREQGHHVMIGGACTEHANSVALMASFGMQQVALYREVGYKFDRWLDVAYLQLILTP